MFLDAESIIIIILVAFMIGFVLGVMISRPKYPIR